MIYKQHEKNTTERTENLIMSKNKKPRRTQRKIKTSVSSVVKNFRMGSVF